MGVARRYNKVTLPLLEVIMVQTDKKSQIQEKLNLALKEIYPMAQKADEQLERLKQDNKGQFSAIFPKGSLFSASANRFLPYLIEVSEDVQSLPEAQSTEQLRQEVQTILGKTQHMYQLLNRFHSIR